MAKGKAATGLLREVIDELAQLAHKGQAKWAKYSGRSRLDNIERFVREEKKLPPEQRPPGKQVCETIEAACESLPDHEWRQAALVHLGFDPNYTDGKISREDEAAGRLEGLGPMSGRTYRGTPPKRHGGREYGDHVYESWSEVTLASVAEALIRRHGGSI